MTRSMPLKRTQSSTGNPAVVVIENAKFQRRSLCRLIRAAGASHVAEAADIAEAERVFASDASRPWLVVADPDLIGPDGLSALKALAAAFPVAGTLLLSDRRGSRLAELRDEAQRQALRLIAALRKPVSAEEMGTLLLQLRSLPQPERGTDTTMRVLSKEELSECLRAGSIRARFQPKVDLESGRPVGCEAAPYVTHVRYGTLHAAAFDHALAQLGAQRVMTASVLRDAAELIRSMRERALDAKVAVKLGTDMLCEPGDATSLDAYVRTLGVAPSDLAFEIAAGKQGTPPRAFDDNLARLKVRGYSLAIDATSASSLDEPAYAHVSEIKLRLRAPEQRGSGTIKAEFSAMLVIARRRGMATCAADMRTEADLHDMRRAGFEFGQGELFAPALTAEEALTWVAREDKARSFADQTPQHHQAG